MLRISIHPHGEVLESIRFNHGGETHWIEAKDEHGNEVNIFLTKDKMKELHEAIGERLS